MGSGAQWSLVERSSLSVVSRFYHFSDNTLTTASHSVPVLILTQVGNMKLFCFIFFLVLGTAAAARAPVSDDEVHFHDESSGLPRQGKQSMLNCLMGCTRELRPVRGEQRGQEQVFANKCSFDIQRCITNRNRGPPLVLSANQDNIVYPSVSSF